MFVLRGISVKTAGPGFGSGRGFDHSPAPLGPLVFGPLEQDMSESRTRFLPSVLDFEAGFPLGGSLPFLLALSACCCTFGVIVCGRFGRPLVRGFCLAPARAAGGKCGPSFGARFLVQNVGPLAGYPTVGYPVSGAVSGAGFRAPVPGPHFWASAAVSEAGAGAQVRTVSGHPLLEEAGPDSEPKAGPPWRRFVTPPFKQSLWFIIVSNSEATSTTPRLSQVTGPQHKVLFLLILAPYCRQRAENSKCRSLEQCGSTIRNPKSLQTW